MKTRMNSVLKIDIKRMSFAYVLTLYSLQYNSMLCVKTLYHQRGQCFSHWSVFTLHFWLFCFDFIHYNVESIITTRLQNRFWSHVVFIKCCSSYGVDNLLLISDNIHAVDRLLFFNLILIESFFLIEASLSRVCTLARENMLLCVNHILLL